MKRLTYLILILPYLCFSQSNFSKGYKVGFIKGHCYKSKQVGNISCIKPIPPISPLSDISKGESENSYQDGYHKGFEDGKIHFIKQNKSNGSNTRYTPRKYPKVYNPDLLALQGMVIQQRNFEKAVLNGINHRYQKVQKQYVTNNQIFLENILNRYRSIDSKKLDRLKLKDGWHDLVMIYDMIYEFLESPIKEVDFAKGYIKNGKLIKLYRSNYIEKESKFPRMYPEKMVFKRGLINFNHTYSDGFKQENLIFSLEQYLNPNYIGIPPMNPANVVLWSKKKKLKGKEVRINEWGINGKINDIIKTKIVYSKEEPKYCNCKLKPGTVELGSARKSYGNFAHPIRKSKKNNINITDDFKIKLESGQCIKIEYK